VALFVIGSVCVLYPYVLLLDGWQDKKKEIQQSPNFNWIAQQVECHT
jgi:hypothetical protein